MIKKIFFLLLFSLLTAQNSSPSEFWNSYNKNEKTAFINGAFGALTKIKSHHKSEVRKQYVHDDNWIQPYYIERFYDIVDEYISKEVGYNLNIISMHMDAFYTNSDNYNIPVLEAMRIVCLMQDGYKKTANLRLLRSQQKSR